MFFDDIKWLPATTKQGAGEAVRDEQGGGPRGGWDFGGGGQASRCREARAGGGGGWCTLFEAWGFCWSGGVSPGIFNITAWWQYWTKLLIQ